MAHVGQEGALGATGRFGRLFRRPQGLGAPLLCGDVLRDAEGADDLPRVVVQRQFRAGDPSGTSVRPGFLLFLVEDALPAAHDFLLVGQGLEGMFVGEEVDVGLADGVARILQSEEARHGLIDAQEAAAGILEIDVVRQVIHERVQQVAFPLQAHVGGGKFGGAIANAPLQIGLGLAKLLLRPAKGAEEGSNSRQTGKDHDGDQQTHGFQLPVQGGSRIAAQGADQGNTTAGHHQDDGGHDEPPRPAAARNSHQTQSDHGSRKLDDRGGDENGEAGRHIPTHPWGAANEDIPHSHEAAIHPLYCREPVQCSPRQENNTFATPPSMLVLLVQESVILDDCPISSLSLRKK